jgi:hypothetical protein
MQKDSWKISQVGQLDSIYTEYRNAIINIDTDGKYWVQTVVYPAYVFCKALGGKYCYSFLSNLKNMCFM